MPEIVGRLRTPRLVAAPSSPIVGEMYYNTANNKLYYWNGTTWIASDGSAALPPDSTKVNILRPGAGGGDAGAFAAAVEVACNFAGDLRHGITPSVNLWWEVEAWSIFRVLDAAWYELDFAIWLDWGPEVADELGQTKSPAFRAQSHSATSPYVTAWPKALFKLGAGKSYTARPVAVPGRGTWTHHTGSTWTGSSSRVVGYW